LKFDTLLACFFFVITNNHGFVWSLIASFRTTRISSFWYVDVTSFLSRQQDLYLLRVDHSAFLSFISYSSLTEGHFSCYFILLSRKMPTQYNKVQHSRHLVQQCRTGDHIYYKMFLVKWEMCLYFSIQTYRTPLQMFYTYVTVRLG
jgi:hypothetical protein